ncbi:glycogen-binding subunit 76A isoform X1 [Agrilus planipennis]|nr:glycogen-binding subunit 76A isoform X1 [Agrilus planipennis]XP_018320736.1 glycogen-binding subunit 76A isoform X1 [Agrilus planipennis]XP_018320744.1 glycogen-binding subunit 76A isoform X1 [Agrilus planipennis]XP_018320751.1 glycogen-binding subunit 76A isoform X1 [Agrilus planipennis]
MSATSDQGKCGLSSLFPMSCRDRAEAFARHLHSRLRSLGTEDVHSATNEATWLTAHENAVAIAQPRHVTENNLYLNLELLESPGSPEEEISHKELTKFFTNSRDNLGYSALGKKKITNGDITKLETGINNLSQDSDDLPYFDTEDKPNERNSCVANGHCDSLPKEEEDSQQEGPSLEHLNCTGEENNISKIENDEAQVLSTSDDSFDISSTSLKAEEEMSPKDDDESLFLESSTCTEDFKSPSEEVSEHFEFNVPCQQKNQLHESNSLVVVRVEPTNVIDSKCHEPRNVDKDAEKLSTSITERRDMPLLSIAANGNNSETLPSSSASELVCLCKKTDVTISLSENDNKNKCQQVVSEEIENKACSNDNPDSTKYSSFLTIDKGLSLECSINALSDTTDGSSPQTTHEVQALLHDIATTPSTEEDSEEKDVRIPRVRRCSSLKTGKTPPGTPGRKKIVRFADVLGLDLADVRTFLDEIPKIPVSAYEDLKDAEFNSVPQSVIQSTLGYTVASVAQPDRILMSLFQQPGGQPDFLDRVRDKIVCLENAMVKDPIDLSIAGTVRVRNLDFNKSVHIRYTLDGWKTFADLQATYVPNSCDGFSDKFTFLIYAHTLAVGQRLEFAIRFHCKGFQYWDNNNGVNYIFQCLPGNNVSFTPELSTEETWGSSFY